MINVFTTGLTLRNFDISLPPFLPCSYLDWACTVQSLSLSPLSVNCRCMRQQSKKGDRERERENIYGYIRCIQVLNNKKSVNVLLLLLLLLRLLRCHWINESSVRSVAARNSNSSDDNKRWSSSWESVRLCLNLIWTSDRWFHPSKVYCCCLLPSPSSASFSRLKENDK